MIITAQLIREIAPGYIGGRELAAKATDSEVLWLTQQSDKVARLRNEAMQIEGLIQNVRETINQREIIIL